ncbi:MAG TPA: DUF393 domain-containing protein [Rhodocyclaceae bacterium]|nr:DUF393 domain-containing protein [Rhodocyclaceae bacterium]
MQKNYPLTLFFDSACPICNREMHALKTRDVHARLNLIDIAAEGFDAQAWGYSAEALDRAMSGCFVDGERVSGLDAILAAYEAVGLAHIFRWTRLPLLRPILDRAYLLFASNRNRFSPLAMPLIALLVPAPETLRADCQSGFCDLEK